MTVHIQNVRCVFIFTRVLTPQMEMTAKYAASHLWR